MKNHSAGSVIRALGWGALLGGGAGFALGLLLAPEEGSRLRRRISYHLEALGTQITELADHVLNPEADSEARRHGQALVADIKEKAQEIHSKMDAILGGVPEGSRPESSES